MLGRVKRAGFQLGAAATEAFRHNVADTMSVAQAAGTTAGHVARALGNASKRAVSASAKVGENASAAMAPGSNTRQAITHTANAAVHAASSSAGVAQSVLHTAGPPIVYGANAAVGHAANATMHIGKAGAQAAVQTAKGLGNAAAAAAELTASHLIPAAQRGFTLAAKALSESVLSAGDIISALSQMELEDQPRYSAHNALENGHHEALGYGAVRGNRANTPTRRNVKGSASSSSSAPRAQERSYATTQEWLAYSHARGILVGELYKRPNWQQFIFHSNTPELRKKLLDMSSTDLAEILVRLDSM